MNVWIINPFDNLPLEGNRPQRYWLLARAFVRAGHDVTLWTSDFSHSRKAKRELNVPGSKFQVPGSEFQVSGSGGETKGTLRFKLTEEGFDLVMIETPGYKRNIGLARIWSHRVFAQRWRAAAEGEKVPDLLVTSLPPLALGAAALAFCRQHGVKLVVDVQDAWPETFERVVPRCLLAPLRKTAKKIYCGADAVVGVAQRYVDLAQSYGATSPMHVFRLGIANSASSRFASSDSRPNALLPSCLHLAYLGNMGASYDLATVITGVKGMENVTLDLAGSGPNEAALLLADFGAGFSYKAGDVGAFQSAVERVRGADRAALRAGAAKLAKEFDAEVVYGGYVTWVEGLLA